MLLSSLSDQIFVDRRNKVMQEEQLKSPPPSAIWQKSAPKGIKKLSGPEGH